MNATVVCASSLQRVPSSKNTVGVAEEEFAQSNVEKKKKKKKEKNVSSKVQEAQREVQTRRWDRDDITKFRTHLFFFFCRRNTDVYLRGKTRGGKPRLKFTSDARLFVTNQTWRQFEEAQRNSLASNH